MNIRKVSAVLLAVFSMSAFADPLSATGDAAANTAAIQSAIDAAVPNGTVTLGEGEFTIDAQLMVTGGVTLVGQGWEKTTIRQTAAKTRVMTIDNGAKLQGVTVTGGRTSDSWAGTAGVQVNDGSISWCRITDNLATGRNSWGGGVCFKKGSIDHSIIDHNQGGDYSGGGGIGVREPADAVLIDTCLVYGNTAPHGQGGGVYFSLVNNHKSITVRNLTVAGNTAGTESGGIYFSENGNNCSLSLVDTVLADNTAGSGDANLVFFTFSDVSALTSSCAAKSSGNVFDNGTAALGEGSMSVEGSGAGWFADPANGNYTPVAGSPAVGKGYNAGDVPPVPPEPVGDPVYKLTIPAKTGLTVSSVTTNGVPVSGVDNAYSIVSNTAVSITFAAKAGYEITGGANPVVVTVEANMTLADSLYPTVQKKQAPTGQIEPGETAAETRQTIQDAIDLAATDSPAGTVTLAEGEFTIDAELMVTGGVKLVGQGWERTTIKQTGTNVRVATIGGGAKIQGVKVTGGNMSIQKNGVGLLVEDGTVSYCRVTGNSGTTHNVYGAGIHISKGTIDHCILDDNHTDLAPGGAIGIREPRLAGQPIFVDTCLIYGNSASKGGGIYAEFNGNHQLLTVRNTTIVGNSASDAGGAIFEQQHNDNKHFDLLLVDSVIADNTPDGGAIAFNSYAGADAAAAARAGCEAQSFGNVLDNDTTFGANSMTVEGSGADWFVDAEGGDYHLANGAAPIAAGVVYDGLGTDLDGIAFNDETPSAGCYEFGGPVVEKKGVIFSIW